MASDLDGSTVSTSTLLRARGGDNDAWCSIWRRYSDRVYRQCRRFGMNAQEAEDLTVDVFQKVWSKLPSFQRESKGQSLGAWIQTITERSALDELRRRKRKFAGAGSDVIEQLVRHLQREGEDGRAELSPVWTALWKALAIVENESSHRTWTCFHMARIEQLPQHEIAEATGMSATNISTTASRTYQKVRDEAVRQLRAAGYVIDASGRLARAAEEDKDQGARRQPVGDGGPV